MTNYNIKILGVGGGGSNTVDSIVEKKIDKGVTYAINTDAQALEYSKAQNKIHIGELSTKGLGAGALPEVGQRAAEESKDILTQELENTNIVFIAAGMGGGTGTGAAPSIAKIAKEMGILTIGVVTKPFLFEGPSRMSMALNGIKNLNEQTDVTIVIPNEKLITNHREKYIEDAFIIPDEVLQTAILAIVEVLENNSTFGSNIDLNDLKVKLGNKGLAVMGMGESNAAELSGLDNLQIALERAMNSEILEISVDGAQEFIVQISGDTDEMSYAEMQAPEVLLSNYLGYEISCTTTLNNEEEFEPTQRKITLIATGYKNSELVEKIVKDDKKTYVKL